MVGRASEGYWDGQLHLSAWQYLGTPERWCGKTQPDWEQDYSRQRDHRLYKMETVGTKHWSLVCFLAVEAMQPAIWSSYLTSLPWWTAPPLNRQTEWTPSSPLHPQRVLLQQQGSYELWGWDEARAKNPDIRGSQWQLFISLKEFVCVQAMCACVVCVRCVYMCIYACEGQRSH